jgi:hypothetical protein
MKTFTTFTISVKGSSEIQRYVDKLHENHKDLSLSSFLKLIKHISLKLNDTLEHEGSSLNYDGFVVGSDGTVSIRYADNHMTLAVTSTELVENGVATVNKFTL